MFRVHRHGFWVFVSWVHRHDFGFLCFGPIDINCFLCFESIDIDGPFCLGLFLCFGSVYIGLDFCVLGP